MAQKATAKGTGEGTGHGGESTAMTDSEARAFGVSEAKAPRTERGRRTLRKLLDASAIEFGEKGFHEASVSSITRRAGMALGSFYTYFDSKDALFRALVLDMSENVRTSARAAIKDDMSSFEIERAALTAFLDLAAEHKEVYRIIDEAEFVDPESYRNHYETVAARIADRLRAGIARGEFRDGLGEVEAWAVMGMNVFIGLRYAIWSNEEDTLSHDDVAERLNLLLKRGAARPE